MTNKTLSFFVILLFLLTFYTLGGRYFCKMDNESRQKRTPLSICIFMQFLPCGGLQNFGNDFFEKSVTNFQKVVTKISNGVI